MNVRRTALGLASTAIGAIALALGANASAQENDGINAEIDGQGRITKLTFDSDPVISVQMHDGEYAGPSFYGHWAGEDRKVTL